MCCLNLGHLWVCELTEQAEVPLEVSRKKAPSMVGGSFTVTWPQEGYGGLVRPSLPQPAMLSTVP